MAAHGARLRRAERRAPGRSQRLTLRSPDAPRRRRRRDVHRRRRRRRRAAGDREGADHAARPVRGRARRGPRGARAGGRGRRTTCARSRTAPRSRPTRCSRGAARGPCSSPPRASRTSSSSAARRAPTSTGCAPRIPPPLVPPERRVGAPERMTPDGPLRALDDPDGARRARRRARARGGRRLPAARVPPSRARAGARRRAARRACRTSTSRSPTRSSARSASTSAPRPPSSTPRSPRCSPPTSPSLAGRAREAGLPAPDVMQSSGGLATLDQARAHAALTVLSGPAGGAAGAAWAALASGERGALCFDMGGTSCDVCVIEDGAARETGSRPGRRAAGRAADARPAHGRRRRRLDRLARRRRRAARRARTRPAPAPGRPPTATAGPSRR